MGLASVERASVLPGWPPSMNKVSGEAGLDREMTAFCAVLASQSLVAEAAQR